ncbi:hypothetical protein ACZ87_02905 [Candidatus Erwinia dacicola]|uniref:Uncharacterized protein n=1 Tax=Candidatus Erwinia dacicola TaxID=252393 RepID=A0A328TM97_9GAMM|nr:hypothetical protein ACZ87_02905 [Candidatus Erwinia dacicola]
MGSCAAPSTKQWHQFTIARSLQQCHLNYRLIASAARWHAAS